MNKDKLIVQENTDLYDRVRKLYKVNLKKSNDEYWGSHIEKGVVIITHCNTKHPIAAFTHELLHIDTQLKGYKRIGGGVSLNKTTHHYLKRLCDCIDNEFQHVKMYREFEMCGFPAAEFYADSDASIEAYLANVLQTPNLPIQVLAVDFLTLIAPGGAINDENKRRLLDLFYDYGNKKYSTDFEAIQVIMQEWAESNDYDAEDYIKRFFVVINAGPTWITYRDNAVNFPNSGYFTDITFTMEELQKAFDA